MGKKKMRKNTQKLTKIYKKCIKKRKKCALFGKNKQKNAKNAQLFYHFFCTP